MNVKDDAANDFWERFVRYRREDGGQAMQRQIDFCRGTFITWVGSGEPESVKAVRGVPKLREKMLSFARDYTPDRGRFLEIVAMMGSGDTVTHGVASKPDPFEEGVLDCLRTEDRLAGAMERLIYEDFRLYLASCGFNQHIIEAAGPWADYLMPHAGNDDL